MTIAREDITGLVLAGGRGSRMGGADKGLQLHRGVPLALHALQRLAPQVGAVALNANRNLGAYAAMGAPVWPDAADASGGEAFAGPLAGWLAGLARCQTPWLVTVPCDTPNFPLTLVQALADAASAAGANLALASGLEQGRQRTQPVFGLLQRELLSSLRQALAAGERKVDRWAAQQRLVLVNFDDPKAFFNANTLAELALLQGPADTLPRVD